MSDQPFKPGDVVRLKSGGPVMTVESIGGMGDPERINCVWFEKTKQMRDGFAAAALKIYEQPKAITVGPNYF
jgi:uncharacterized protein YodC (DUF2158 family)